MLSVSRRVRGRRADPTTERAQAPGDAPLPGVGAEPAELVVSGDQDVLVDAAAAGDRQRPGRVELQPVLAGVVVGGEGGGGVGRRQRVAEQVPHRHRDGGRISRQLVELGVARPRGGQVAGEHRELDLLAEHERQRHRPAGGGLPAARPLEQLVGSGRVTPRGEQAGVGDVEGARERAAADGARPRGASCRRAPARRVRGDR